MWSRKYSCCIRCGLNRQKHHGHGLCGSCYSTDWRQSKGQELIEYKKRWYENSKETVDYRARNQRNKNGPVEEVFAKYGGKCLRCGSTEKLHIHHIDQRGSNVPKSQRNNKLENLELLCIKCHGSEHGKLVGWSKKFDKCQLCGLTDKNHHAHGYCTRCLWKVQVKV